MPPRRHGPQVPYRAVADALRGRLDAGEWLPGEALPGARVLAAEYGVSHATITRAMGVLAEEGRVTVVRGWGTFVAERG
jgi:DNA-binding GntR family transcriptional regulator